MNTPTVDEFSGLNEALKNAIEQTENTADPILAGGVCVLYKSRMLEMLSVEAADIEFGSLHALSVALLEALVKQEDDLRVKRPLQQALQLAAQAQKRRLTAPPGKLN